MIPRIFIIFSLLLFACSKNTPEPNYDILVLGHIYQWNTEGNKIDRRLEDVDYSAYKELWLLGDLCSESTREMQTINYLDSIFDLADFRTKWAVGNHDVRNGNLHFITQATGRELYYGELNSHCASYVLNTQMQHPVFVDSCDYKELQHADFLSFLEQIKDQDSIKHLFILSHNTIWSDAEETLREFDLIGNAHAGWVDMICQRNGEFMHQYLDVLSDIQNREIQVYCIAGDGGQYRKSFYEVGESGIKYFVTGINNSFKDNGPNEELENRFDTRPDSVLVFQYDDQFKTFLHKFIPVEYLR